MPPPALGCGATPRLLLVTGPPDSSGRLLGLDMPQVGTLRAWAGASRRTLLVEADGSRLRPLKAAAAHEPAIPPTAQTVVVTAGLSALGQPLDDAHVHRAALFSTMSRCPLGERVTAGSVVAVLTHPDSGLKDIPSASRRVALLNQADTPDLARLASSLGRAPRRLPPRCGGKPPAPARRHVDRARGRGLRPLRPRTDRGDRSRGGRDNPLRCPQAGARLSRQAFVRAVAETALAASLSPVVVVTGAGDEAVAAALRGLPVVLAHNPRWPSGQSTSVRAGVETLPPDTGAAVFLLADQPQVSAGLVLALTERHATTLSAIVAPVVGGRRVSPVLFDRSVFPDFSTLTGDDGGSGCGRRRRAGGQTFRATSAPPWVAPDTYPSLSLIASPIT